MVQDADDHATKVLSTIREIVRAGTVSVHKIASAMNERGVPTRRGGSWSGTSVSNTIRRCGFQSVKALAGSA
ncbi:MAG: recombinase family protein [Rhodospirillaceae bacterium]